jgi:hypothetical protein
MSKTLSKEELIAGAQERIKLLKTAEETPAMRLMMVGGGDWYRCFDRHRKVRISYYANAIKELKRKK